MKLIHNQFDHAKLIPLKCGKMERETGDKNIELNLKKKKKKDSVTSSTVTK